MYIRNQLEETMKFLKDQPRQKTGQIVKSVVGDNGFGMLIGLLLVAGGTITQYFLINMTPYAIRTLHLPDATAMLGGLLGVAGAIGSLVGGALGDRFGVMRIAVAPRILLIIALIPGDEIPGRGSDRDHSGYRHRNSQPAVPR